MKPFRVQSAVDQLTNHIRDNILRGSYGQRLPGTGRIAQSEKVNRKTVCAAVSRLEEEGLIVNQGQGLRRKIVLPENYTPPCLRVGIMLYDAETSKYDVIIELVHQLQSEGHEPIIAGRTLRDDLHMDVKKVAQYIETIPMDAWIVVAGSMDILKWFSMRPVPAFALFGRRRTIDIAGTGPDTISAMVKLAQRLHELGHRRIVLLAHEERRKPHCGTVEKAFLDQLQALGIKVGPYNLPDWVDTPAGLEACLDSLFRLTPPTALVTETLNLFTGVNQFLLRRGIRVPDEVSIACSNPAPDFDWWPQGVAHLTYDSGPWVHTIVHWVNQVAIGENDRKQTLCPSQFIDGGTLGPVPIS